MKKVFLFLAFVTFTGSVLTSCKAHKPCDAYSKAKKVDTELNIEAENI